MSKSKIEWTDRTWNPVTGCTKVSQGCKNCYAERLYERFHGHGSFKNVLTHSQRLHQPFSWKKPSMVFVNSMSDLFHEAVSFDFIDHVFIVMAMNPKHTFQVLTKRPERMLEYFKSRTEGDYWDYFKEKVYDGYQAFLDNDNMPPGWLWDKTYTEFGKDVDLIYDGPWPLPNVWLGVSVENKVTADERIPLLSMVPAAVRFLSCEPLLGPIKFSPIVHDTILGKMQAPALSVVIDWVICGGESGPGARPMDPNWARLLRDQCEVAGVAFFFKQWGEYTDTEHAIAAGFGHLMPNGKNYNNDGSFLAWRIGKKNAGRLLDGREHNEFPHLTYTKATL